MYDFSIQIITFKKIIILQNYPEYITKIIYLFNINQFEMDEIMKHLDT